MLGLSPTRPTPLTVFCCWNKKPFALISFFWMGDGDVDRKELESVGHSVGYCSFCFSCARNHEERFHAQTQFRRHGMLPHSNDKISGRIFFCVSAHAPSLPPSVVGARPIFAQTHAQRLPILVLTKKTTPHHWLVPWRRSWDLKGTGGGVGWGGGD